MGAALAVRKRDEAQHEARPTRRALGPSEQSTRGGSAVQRLLSLRSGDVSLPERRARVKEMFFGELAAIGTFGAAEVPHIIEAIEHGHTAEAVEKCIEAGFALQHAVELVEAAASRIGTHALTHADHSVGMAISAGKLLHDWAKLAGSAIRDAHDAGRSDAMLANYAQTFARTVVDALYGEGIARPEHTGLAELDSARAEAFHHAMELLRSLDAGSAGEMATALKQELGTASNARMAIIELILAQHGKQGIVLHAGAPTR